MTPVESRPAPWRSASRRVGGRRAGDHRARTHARGSGRRAGRHRLRRPRADIRQGGELPGRAHDSVRAGRHRPAHRHPGRRGRADRARARPRVSYEDIGGLEREMARVREIVELPLKHSRIFERLGILAPKGVLLYGPPGHRQDAARARRRRREPRALHPPQRPRDHAEVLRRERGQAPRGLRGGGAPRAGDPLHRRDRRRGAQARRGGRRGREARRRAAARA